MAVERRNTGEGEKQRQWRGKEMAPFERGGGEQRPTALPAEKGIG